MLTPSLEEFPDLLVVRTRLQILVSSGITSVEPNSIAAQGCLFPGIGFCGRSDGRQRISQGKRFWLWVAGMDDLLKWLFHSARTSLCWTARLP